MYKKVLVVLDPGHYPNYNKGAVTGYFEGDKMYDYSEYERDALKAYGIDAVITRNRNNDMELYSRGQVAVKNAVGYDEVVFISNHSNAFSGQACGVEIYRSLYLPGSEELGKKLMDAIVGIMKPVTGITYARGVKTREGNNGDYYGVIRGSLSGATSEAKAKKGPVGYSYLIEHGFHDNPIECAFLNNAANLKKMAEAEAKAIADYFGLAKSSGSATVDTPVEMPTDNPAEVAEFKVKVNTKDLNIRKGPGCKKYASVGYCPVGVYTIVETKSADGYTWGRLKSGAGWIALEYVERL